MSKLSEQTGVDWELDLGSAMFPWMETSEAMWGGLTGKDDDDGGAAATSPSGQQASEIATQMYQETEPIRQEVIRRGERFMGDGKGGFDPTASAMYKPSRRALEEQYVQSQELARQTMPTGGALDEAMAANIRARAGGLTDIEGRIAQDEYNKAYGLATGVPALSMSTLTGLAGAEMSAAAQQEAAKSGMMGDFGMAIGSYFGGK